MNTNKCTNRAASAKTTPINMSAQALTPLALMLATLIGVTAAGSADAQELVPLVAFFSPSRGDYFTTSQHVWTSKYFGDGTAAENAVSMGDYHVVGMQGLAFNPTRPQPSGTLTLWHWFSANRGDNFLTTHPAWNPASSTSRWEGGANYRFVRVAGFVNSNSTRAGGGLDLLSFWNPGFADNAALTTPNAIVFEGEPPLNAPAGYGMYRFEGSLLPPRSDSFSRADHGAAPDTHPSPWFAYGNYITTWPQPDDFLDGDTIRITAPVEAYGYSQLLWENSPVRGRLDIPTDSSYPAPRLPALALMARVTTGRIFVAGQGWFEANQWFRALEVSLIDGVVLSHPGPGALMVTAVYDARGVRPGNLEMGFNDPYRPDNRGGANVTIHQWFE